MYVRLLCTGLPDSGIFFSLSLESFQRKILHSADALLKTLISGYKIFQDLLSDYFPSLNYCQPFLHTLCWPVSGTDTKHSHTRHYAGPSLKQSSHVHMWVFMTMPPDLSLLAPGCIILSPDSYDCLSL